MSFLEIKIKPVVSISHSNWYFLFFRNYSATWPFLWPKIENLFIGKGRMNLCQFITAAISTVISLGVRWIYKAY